VFENFKVPFAVSGVDVQLMAQSVALPEDRVDDGASQRGPHPNSVLRTGATRAGPVRVLGMNAIDQLRPELDI
jgi:hypothetical protein